MVIVTPWYVSSLGVSGYGIISLWLMMQLLMGFLDMGMGATLIRGFSQSRFDKKFSEYRQDLLRTLEIFYWSIAVIIGLVFLGGGDWFSTNWLHVELINGVSAPQVILVMGLSLCLQFPYILYASGFTGLQKHRQMNLFQILGNSLRYGVGAIVLFWRADLFLFFTAQAIVSVILVFSTRHVLWKYLKDGSSHRPRLSLTIIKSVFAFSIGMAATSLVSVLLANADRLVLSKMVSTYQLGLYALAFTATGLLQLGIQPFYRVFFPKYTQLVSSGDMQTLRKEYYRSCQLVANMIIPIAIIGGIFAEELFNIWLQTYEPETLLVFRWLLVGVGCSGLAWLPAAFQQANGYTRLHVQMMASALIIGFPLMILMIQYFGVVGGVTIWVLHGISDITIGLWLMHKRFFVGEFCSWYKNVLFSPLAISILVALVMLYCISSENNKWLNFSLIVMATSISVLLNFLLEIFCFARPIKD